MLNTLLGVWIGLSVASLAFFYQEGRMPRTWADTVALVLFLILSPLCVTIMVVITAYVGYSERKHV